MYPLYEEVNSLDKLSCEKYKIPEILMMENAAHALKKVIEANTPKNSKVLFVCGPGNNGADGLACARLLMDEYEVLIYIPYGVKSKLAKLQLEILESLHVSFVEDIECANTVVDALLGSGARELDDYLRTLVARLNEVKAYKIACDLPTGLGQGSVVFQANTTVTMGALKVALYEESAIGSVGEIVVGNLGMPRESYEIPSNTYVLDKKDMHLPQRNNETVHKGNFGHLLVLGGQKSGASIMAAEAGFGFGVGLVSVWGEDEVPPHIMRANKLPPNTTAIAAGMGMGNSWQEQKIQEVLFENKYPLVLDADLCSMGIIKECFSLSKPIVITPHPKEFAALLLTCKGIEVEVKDIQKNRIKYAKEFTRDNEIVLVLKGAHTIVSQKGEVYISPYSAPSLAKGGSGDVLAGMVGALLAQGYSAKEAAITSVLAHVLAARSLNCNSYALTPNALIERVKCL